MIWGRNDVTGARLQQAKATGQVLLGFNEPDRSDQADISAATALSLWPDLESTGMRLGAPAVAALAQVRGSWLDTFMSGAATQGRRVDFIPLHWYPTPEILSSRNAVDAAVNELSQYLQSVYTRYQLPLWLTEFSLIGWKGNSSVVASQKTQAEFLAAADSMMLMLPYLERWAWFSLTPFSTAIRASLYDAKATITASGQRFRIIAAAR